MSGKENKTKMIKVRMTPEERDLIDAAVAAQVPPKEKTISSFIRSLAITRARRVVDARQRDRARARR